MPDPAPQIPRGSSVEVQLPRNGHPLQISDILLQGPARQQCERIVLNSLCYCCDQIVVLTNLPHIKFIMLIIVTKIF